MEMRKKILILIIMILVVIGGAGACYYIVKYNLYDPVKTLKISNPKIKIYFVPESDGRNPFYGTENYDSIKLDYRKHRIIEYYVEIANIGPRFKDSILLIPMVSKEFKKKYVLKGDRDFIHSIAAPKRGKIFSGPIRYYYLTEGDPQEIKEIISKYNKAKVVWEEGGKRYEKIIENMKVEILD